jgi:hypothetical protein
VLPILKCLSEMIPGVELESVYADIEKGVWFSIYIYGVNIYF